MTDRVPDAGAGAPGVALKFVSGASFAKGLARLVVASALAAVGILALTAAPASAVTGHTFSTSFGATGSGDGQLSAPAAIAVNDNTHNVYVADSGNARIVEFDSTGSFIRAFGADVGGAGVDTCTSGCQAGTPGGAPGAFASTTFVAVDNSAGPSAGSVYVADTGSNLVTKFDSTGNLVPAWGAGGQLSGTFGPIAGITVDTAGVLDVFDTNTQMWEFAEDGTPTTAFSTDRGTSPNGLAVDSAGNFFKVNGDPTVEKFDGFGNDVGQATKNNGTTGLATDLSTDDLYVSVGGSVDHYTFPPCTPVPGNGCDPGDSFGSGDLNGAKGLAIDPLNQILYVADSGSDRVAVFTPIVLPGVATDPASAATATTATLNGTVDPDSVAVTDCHFEYTDAADFNANGFANASNAACVPDPGSGSGAVAVSADLTGLDPGVNYHVRLLAANVNGTSTGIDQPFSTDPAVKALATNPATVITATTATLNGTLDPDGAAITDCHFEYTGAADFNANGFANATHTACVPDPGSAPSDVAVSADLTGLTADSGYHFRLVATNAIGTTKGDDQPFATEPAIKDLSTLPATAVTATTATLTGTLDPNGHAITDCHFDYGTTTAYGQSASCAPDPGSAPGDVAVHADLSGLEAATNYHFRLQATNADGTTLGSDRNVITLGPRISGELADHISDTAASLHADVNPQGAPTTYRFQYVSDATFQATGYAAASTAPAAPAAIGSGNGDVSVGERISGLQPATTYHFRLVAISAVGTSHGPDATFLTFTAPPNFDPCANDALRTGHGSALPDCRAYEQASPVAKRGADIQSAVAGDVEASRDGDRVTFPVPAGLPTSTGSTGLTLYAASRGPSNWSTNGLSPVNEPGYGGFGGTLLGWAEDLSSTLSQVESDSGSSLLVGDTDAGTWQQLGSIPASDSAYLAGFASDASHFIFEDKKALAPGAVGAAPNLYDVDHGTLTLAGRVPAFPVTSCDDGGAPADACVPAPAGSFAGPYDSANGGGLNSGGASQRFYTPNTISADGSKVFFTERGTGRLYMRNNGTTTTQISASQASSPDPNGHKPAAWRASTPSGSKVFFLSCEKLTDDSTAVATAANTCTTSSQGQDLYSYDTSSGGLTDLTADSGPANPLGAAVQGVLGASSDGSDVYFVANGDLDGPGPALAGDCSAAGRSGGACSLYLSHAGAIAFVGRLDARTDPSDYSDWRLEPGLSNGSDGPRSARVAPDGTLLFRSTAQLTAYDNAGPTCDPSGTAPGRCAELYRYQPGDSGPVCVSCDPTGSPPIGGAQLQSLRQDSASQPAQMTFLSRNLSADGNRIFFDTTDPLVPADTNAAHGCPANDSDGLRACTDVYEWEAEGSGSCHSSDANGGCLYLLSAGSGPDPSYFGDASASGDDAFIFTRDPLVPQDTDQLVDAYDVRVGGGLLSQHPITPPPCSGDVCQGAPGAPIALPVAGSVTFAGVGNGPGRPGASATLRPRVLSSRAVRGSRAVLSVKVPSRGRLTVSGTGLRGESLTAAKAGTYKLSVRLSARARRTWRKAHVLKVRAKVVFAPRSGGVPATATVTLTFRTVTTTKKGR